MLKLAVGSIFDNGVGVTVGAGVVVPVLLSIISDSPLHAVRRVSAANVLAVLKDITLAILIYDFVILARGSHYYGSLFTVTVYR